MASLLTHAAVPLIAKGAVPVPGIDRRVTIAAVLLSCWPDLDYATLAFEVRPNEPFGHRGITHSLVVAAVLSLAVTVVGFRGLGLGSRTWWRVAAFLFFAAASHGLLDAVTSGDIGVALFAPLDNKRHFLPLKRIPCCPVGINEYLGYWGIMTIANEILYVILPLALAVSFIRLAVADGIGAAARRLRLSGLAWAACLVILRTTMPDFKPTLPRTMRPINTMQAGMLRDIPVDGLPVGKLTTRLSELSSLGLFDRTLTPAVATWSSSFFPFWFGSEGGRWMDGAPTLTWRTLFGFAAPTEADARQWLLAADHGDTAAQQRLFSLAPTEKLDLVTGRWTFPATGQSLARTHNARPRPRYWSGRCNGIANASLNEPEPFRVVDVIGVDGSHVRFHPNDIKSLLAVAYDQTPTMTIVGEVCVTVSFDAPATCSMSPAVLVVALLNRIGLARQSFLIDALPTVAKQYYAIAGARVHAGTPRRPLGVDMDSALAGKVASLVDVDIELTLSSTTLPYARGNQIDPAFPDGTHYLRVGLAPVVMKYSATLALDDATELIGGEWTGDPADGPDDMFMISGGPLLVGNRIELANEISWPLVRELAHASVDEGPSMPTVDLRTQCDGRCPM